MCSNYEGLKEADQLVSQFGAHRSIAMEKYHLWPGYQGVFVIRPPELDSGDEAVPAREALAGRWGMIAPLTRTEQLVSAEKLATFNAKSETVHKLWTFRSAWARGQRCVIPADAIFEPDHRRATKARFSTSKAIATRFTRADARPLGLAGLWDRYRNADGTWQFSYTMLTINADDDPLFKHYHAPDKEKRMVVVLPEGSYSDWLEAPPDATRDFLVPYPADRLVATPVAPNPR